MIDIDKICALSHQFYIIPVIIHEDADGKRHKTPAMKFHLAPGHDEEKVREHYEKHPDHGVGVKIEPGTILLDIDERGDISGWSSMVGIDKDNIKTLYQITPTDGYHLFFKEPKGVTFKVTSTDVFGKDSKVDIRAPGNSFAVIDPTEGYTMISNPIQEMPQELLDALIEADVAIAHETESITSSASKGHATVTASELKRDLSKLNVEDYNTRGKWIQIMMSAHSGTGGLEFGKEIFTEWSLGDPSFAKDKGLTAKISREWNALKADGPVTMGTIKYEVQSMTKEVDELENTKIDDEPWNRVKGKLAPTENNVYLAMTEKFMPAPNVKKENPLCDLIIQNSLESIPIYTRRPPWAVEKVVYKNQMPEPSFIASIRRFIAKEFKFSATEGAAERAVGMVCDARKFNPIKDYIKSLPEWDGVPRCATLLENVFRFKKEDLEYVRLASTKFMLALIHRGMVPGCKLDWGLHLIGHGGTGKTTFVKALVPDYSGEPHIDIRDKDAEVALQGLWLAEWPEMQGFHSSMSEQFKAFMSKTSNRLRPAFGKMMITYKRGTVLIFTTNTNSTPAYSDSAMARRFMPVSIENYANELGNIQYIIDNREQIFAEAYALFKQGLKAYCDPAEDVLAQRYQLDRLDYDPWEDKVLDFCIKVNSGYYTVMDIAIHGLNLTHREAGDRKITRRIGAIMKGAGYEYKPKRIDGRLIRVYARIDEAKSKRTK